MNFQKFARLLRIQCQFNILLCFFRACILFELLPQFTLSNLFLMRYLKWLYENKEKVYSPFLPSHSSFSFSSCFARLLISPIWLNSRINMVMLLVLFQLVEFCSWKTIDYEKSNSFYFTYFKHRHFEKQLLWKRKKNHFSF